MSKTYWAKLSPRERSQEVMRRKAMGKARNAINANSIELPSPPAPDSPIISALTRQLAHALLDMQLGTVHISGKDIEALQKLRLMIYQVLPEERLQELTERAA